MRTSVGKSEDKNNAESEGKSEDTTEGNGETRVTRVKTNGKGEGKWKGRGRKAETCMQRAYIARKP